MTSISERDPASYIAAISASELIIYDDLSGHPGLFVPTDALQAILSSGLNGVNLDFPLRTRSKKIKEHVCRALGYPVPKSFKKTQPRFPGQNFDTYVQKADNLQIFNEEISAGRRYVLVRVNDEHIVTAVRVLTGEQVAKLDTTGTLTLKYQATSKSPVTKSVLVSKNDTQRLRSVQSDLGVRPIAEVYRKLKTLTGQSFLNPGLDQERNRGAIIHRLAQNTLGGDAYSDSGQFPDIPEELLEIKLQTSPTIDLGLVSPDSTEPLAIEPSVRHCDVRYAVFYGDIVGDEVTIHAVVMSTGADFFTFFCKFGGREVNRKLQIPLPKWVFE